MSHCLSRCSSVSSSMYDQEIWSSSSEVPRIFKRISEVPRPKGLTQESHRYIEQKRRYYSFPLPDSVLKPILKNIHNIRNIKDFKIPENLPNGIYNELARLKLSLIAYDELVEDRLFDPLLVLEQTLTLGPKYADWLKDFRDYSVKISGAIQMVSDDELDVTCTENLKSWDQIFPPEYLFPFERDCQKDYELMFEASRDPEKEIVDAFRRKVRNTIRKDMNKIAPPRHDDLDFLSSMGSQSSFDLKGKKRVPKSFLLAKNGKGKPPDKGSFLCSPAWKNAAEMRAAVIPTPDTLISLLMLERMSSLCFRIKEDVFWRRDFSFLSRYLSRYDTIYISADIKKFGLTFPIWLVKEVIDAIDETYPLWDIQKYAKAILNREIYFLDEEEPRVPKRGFGMGMINGIGSICMALLFKVFKDSVEIPENYRLDGIFYNDDQEFRLINLKGGLDVSSEELAVDLTYKWNEFCGRAGLTMHKKKPFISRNGLFCEVYGENFPVNCNKKFKRYVNLLNSFSSCNIVEAKNFVSSVVPCLEIDEGYLKYFISRCISFFGYEFNREECVLPFELGGWTPFIDGGNNCLFDFMVNCSHHFHQYFGLVKTHRRIQTDRKAPSYRKYVEFYKDWIDNNIIESIPQLDFASMLRSAIGAPNRDTIAEVKSWENFKRLRMKSVMNFRKSKQTIGSLIRELISEKLSSGRGLYSIPKEYIDPEDESWIEVSDVKRIMVSMPRIFDLGRTFLSMNKFMGRIDIDIYSFHEHIDLPPLVKAYLEFFLLALWLGYKEGRSTRELEHLLICGLGYQQKMIAHIRSMLPSAVGFNGCTAEVISYRKFCTVKGIPLVDNEHMLWAPPGTPWLRPIAKEPFFQSDEELYLQWKNTWSENTHEILDSRYDDFMENSFWKNILSYYTSFYEKFLEKKKNTVPRDKMDPLAVDIDREIKDSLIEVDDESLLEFSDDDQDVPDFEYNFEMEDNSPDLYPMEIDEVYVVGEGENADEFEDIEDFDCDFSFPDPSEIG